MNYFSLWKGGDWMIPANLEIKLDRKAIREFIELEVNSTIKSQLWLVDLEKISELTSMSKRFLEDEIVNDVRMKSIEIRKNRKRWWPAKKTFEVINEIINEW